MREGCKKNIKKNIESIFRKGNEGDEIKKKLTYLKKRYSNEGDEKNKPKKT